MRQCFFWAIVTMIVFAYKSGASQADPYSQDLNCKTFTRISTTDILGDSLENFGIECCVYSGEANFKGRVFSGQSVFIKSLFNPKTDFSNSVFLGPVYFHDVNFFSRTDFSRIHAIKQGGFQRSRFVSVANFSHAQFDTVGNFFYARFDSLVTFANAAFLIQASFVGTRFHDVNFSNADLGTRTYFLNADFKGNAVFHKAKMDSIAVFKNASIEQTLDLSDATLGQWADWTHLKVNGNLVLNNTHLPDTLLLIGIKDVAGLIDFTTCAYNNKNNHRIDLFNSDLSKFKFDYSHFNLYFSESYEITDEEKIGLMEELLQVQQNYGFVNGFKKLDIEYKEFNNLVEKKYIKNWFEKHWLGYGYNTLFLILRNLMIIVIIGFGLWKVVGLIRRKSHRDTVSIS